jgi:hypothetical protein
MSYTALASTDFVVSSDSITAPAWSSNQPTLSTFFTASIATSTSITSDAFYLNVYQTASTAVGAAVQFSIAYGNQTGLGANVYNGLVTGVTPSLTTYKQYKNLVYGPTVTGSQGFNFGGTATNASDIFAINIDRNRYKESLFPGTFNLKLSGSAGTISLCDNSLDSSVITYLDCGRVFDIVSGSNGHAATTTSTSQISNGYTVSGSYGLFLPDIGVIILNPRALALNAAYGGIGMTFDATYTAATPYSSINNTNLFNAISGSGAASFQLNSQETISSNYIFVRVKNAEYNYTSNPTFLSGSGGGLVYSTLINSPQTYVTTVGLYNQNSDLLAVAKMSRPMVKDFTKEALIRVKLDW